jgi:ribosomal protein S18 acetylase RimI-like enzyme
MATEAGKAFAGLSWYVTSGGYAPGTVERLLRLLPGWFGIDSSNAGYIQKARELPAYLAWPGAERLAHGGQRQAPGVLLAIRHFPWAAEIYLMAVNPGMHRRGAGRALVKALEADLIADGVEFLQVKPSARPCRMSAMTRPGGSMPGWVSAPWRKSTAYGRAIRASS